MVQKVPHLAGNKIIRLPDVYGKIGDICGIKKIDNTTPAPAGAESIKVNAAVEAGIIRRANVRLSNKKIKTVYFLAANAPKITAIETLEYTAGLTISSAYYPQHFTFG